MRRVIKVECELLLWARGQVFAEKSLYNCTGLTSDLLVVTMGKGIFLHYCAVQIGLEFLQPWLLSLHIQVGHAEGWMSSLVLHRHLM